MRRRGRGGPLIWIAAAAMVGASCAGGSTEDAALIERGAQLYDASCVRCHGGPTGGTISDIPPRHNAAGHTWHHPDCLLTRIILDGPPPRPGAGEDFPAMPAFRDQLSEDDVAAILALMRSWWTGEQRAFQAEITDRECRND